MAVEINGHDDFRTETNSNSKGFNSENGADDKVCRDFMRKVCHRGSRCKFIHPIDGDVQPSEQPKKRELTFCHDFQNGFCPRTSCRFMHCSVGEEDYYMRTGHIMPHILVQATMKGQIMDSPNGEVPICKDFLMGDCLRKRGGKCRFRHLTKSEFECEVYSYKNEPREHCDIVQDNKISLPDAKRLRYDPGPPTDFYREPRDREFIRPMEDFNRMDIMPMSLRELRDRDRELDRERDRRGLEEILLLRKQLETLKKEIASLKKENSDLRATNDFLLEKVTTLGISKGGGTVTTVTVPTVSLASTIPVATTVRPLSITTECSVATVGSVVALAPPLSAPIVASQPLAPQAQQVGVAPPPNAVLGSVGSVQVSLAQAPTLSAVSLNPPIVTETAMSPSIAPSIAPPPPGSATTLGQAISMSGASAHLVSYPIMTQTGLRPQI